MKKENEKKLHSSRKHAMRVNENREQLRAYFEKVLNLRNSGEPFPVDLDEVWPLAYSRKDHAVRVLLKKFIPNKEYITQKAENQRLIQNEENAVLLQVADYQFFPQNEENSSKEQTTDNQRFRQNAENLLGRPVVTYKLSTFCLEWLIAREVPEVFEVYQKVFYLMADAMIPINGVFPILYKGQVLYNYNEMLRSISFSTRSGSVSKRKRQFPQHFVKVGPSNYITPHFARYLMKQKEQLLLQQEMKSAQGYLPFAEED